jgi:hypothetical protein
MHKGGPADRQAVYSFIVGGYRNIHGRRAGRGIRPWILLPKVLCVGITLGSLVTAAVLSLIPPVQGPGTMPLLRQILVWVTTPALAASGILGVALLAQHPNVLLRLRWLQAKLLVTLGFTPALSAWGMSRYRLLTVGGAGDAAGGMASALGAAVLVLIVIILLGRQKPRLGQNWARSYPARKA